MNDNINDEEKETTDEYSDVSVNDEESSVPLNFDYYRKTDNSSLKKTIIIALTALFSIIAVAGALRTIDKRHSNDNVISESESSYYDSYPGSPYADDTVITEQGMTDNGLGYTLYESHARITSFKDVMVPIDLTVPASIRNMPVTEIDYFVFSYCQLKSLTISNPDCIFFDSFDDFPPVPAETAIIAPEGSDAQKIAEKYGNPFTAK